MPSRASFDGGGNSGTLGSLRDSERTKLLGWPGYRVHRHEINERAKTLKLWIRRKRGNRKLVCSGCGRKLEAAHDVSERQVRDLPRMEFGYQGTCALTSRFPNLCRAIARKELQSRAMQRARLRAGLISALSEEPPPATAALARRLGCSHRYLEYYFPDLYQRLLKARKA